MKKISSGICGATVTSRAGGGRVAKRAVGCAGLLAAVFLAGPLAGGQEKTMPLLTTAANTFTNVTVLNVTADQLLFTHAGGIGSVQLEDLDPQLQKEFGYDKQKAVAPAAAKTGHLAATAPADPPGPDGAGTNDIRKVNDKSAAPRGARVKTYDLEKKGVLTLLAPSVWVDSAVRSPAGSPASLVVRFKREYSDEFVVMINTIPGEESIRRMGLENALTMTGNRALAGSVEKKLTFKELAGEEASGLYYTLTNEAIAARGLKPGAYKYQTLGLVQTGDMLLSFAICFNYPGTSDEKAALEMIQSASFNKK